VAASVGEYVITSVHPRHEFKRCFSVVRTMLEAIISFMPTEGAGAIGALDWSKKERQICARESQAFVCPLCGPIANLCPVCEEGEEAPSKEIASQVAQLKMAATAPPPTSASSSSAGPTPSPEPRTSVPAPTPSPAIVTSSSASTENAESKAPEQDIVSHDTNTTGDPPQTDLAGATHPENNSAAGNTIRRRSAGVQNVDQTRHGSMAAATRVTENGAVLEVQAVGGGQRRFGFVQEFDRIDCLLTALLHVLGSSIVVLVVLKLLLAMFEFL
jgi:hypothetical protein